MGGGKSASTSRELINCTNYGDVKGTYSLGGICGYFADGKISKCINLGSVEGSGNLVGGICGYAGGANLLSCENRGNIKGGTSVGGIIGTGGGDVNYKKTSINSCVNNGSHLATDTSGKSGNIVGNNLGVTIN